MTCNYGVSIILAKNHNQIDILTTDTGHENLKSRWPGLSTFLDGLELDDRHYFLIPRTPPGAIPYV